LFATSGEAFPALGL